MPKQYQSIRYQTISFRHRSIFPPLSPSTNVRRLRGGTTVGSARHTSNLSHGRPTTPPDSGRRQGDIENDSERTLTYSTRMINRLSAARRPNLPYVVMRSTGSLDIKKSAAGGEGQLHVQPVFYGSAVALPFASFSSPTGKTEPNWRH